MKPISLEKITDILLGDAEKAKNQLLISSLFIAIFESFKTKWREEFLLFFSDETSFDGKNLTYKFNKSPGQKENGYYYFIGKYGKDTKTTNEKESRAAIGFLKELQFIDEVEYKTLINFNVKRNKVGHELMNILLDDSEVSIEKEELEGLVNIYKKVTINWFEGIEAATDPDLLNKNINFQEVVHPFSEMLDVLKTKIFKN